MSNGIEFIIILKHTTLINSIFTLSKSRTQINIYIIFRIILKIILINKSFLIKV